MSLMPPKDKGVGIGASIRLQMSFHSVSDGKQILKGLNGRKKGGVRSRRVRAGGRRAQRGSQGSEQCQLPGGYRHPGWVCFGLGAPSTGLPRSMGCTQLTERPYLGTRQPERAEQAELPAGESLSDRAAVSKDRGAESDAPAKPGWRAGRQ